MVGVISESKKQVHVRMGGVKGLASRRAARTVWHKEQGLRSTSGRKDGWLVKDRTHSAMNRSYGTKNCHIWRPIPRRRR